MAINFTLNGSQTSVDVNPQTPLLWVLRDVLGLTGTKFGCGMALCGACTVHMNGGAIRSCITPVSNVAGKSVTTIEGLGTTERPHPLQRAFLDEQAGQCGYCLSGIIISAKALLDRNPSPSRTEIAAALDNHLCRCGTHTRIITAVQKAAMMGASA